MNKLVLYFDPVEIASLGSAGPIPDCLIFNNFADASDWFKKNDCTCDENFKIIGVFTIKRFGKTLNGKYMWGKAFI